MGDSVKRRSGRQPAFSEINVTPMVDVMLVLLVIFMVTAPMLTTGVSVNLPESSATPVAGNDEPLTVSVTSEGKVYIQKTEVPMKDLAAKLKAVTSAKKDTRIFVRGDKNINYGKIVQVFGEIETAGFTKVALVTEVGSVTDRGR